VAKHSLYKQGILIFVIDYDLRKHVTPTVCWPTFSDTGMYALMLYVGHNYCLHRSYKIC